VGGELGQQFRAASIAEPITPPHTTESVSEHIRSLTRGPAAVYQCAVLGRFPGLCSVLAPDSPSLRGPLTCSLIV
jgi:hypothetical protein